MRLLDSYSPMQRGSRRSSAPAPPRARAWPSQTSAPPALPPVSHQPFSATSIATRARTRDDQINALAVHPPQLLRRALHEPDPLREVGVALLCVHAEAGRRLLDHPCGGVRADDVRERCQLEGRLACVCARGIMDLSGQ